MQSFLCLLSKSSHCVDHIWQVWLWIYMYIFNLENSVALALSYCCCLCHRQQYDLSFSHPIQTHVILLCVLKIRSKIGPYVHLNLIARLVGGLVSIWCKLSISVAHPVSGEISQRSLCWAHWDQNMPNVFVWALLVFGWAFFRQEIVCSHVESGSGAVRADGEADCTAPNAKLFRRILAIA